MSLIPLGILAASSVAEDAYESIATVTVGSGGAASVSFTSIPGNFAALQLRVLARSTVVGNVSDNIAFTVNGDTGNNYSTHILFGDGFSEDSDAFTGLSAAFFASTIPGSGILANVFGNVVADFADYANTNKNTTIRALSGYDENINTPGNFANRIQLSSAFYNSTTAITSITFTTSSGFAQYTSFALYGIKGA
jgi:hypothetical protein